MRIVRISEILNLWGIRNKNEGLLSESFFFTGSYDECIEVYVNAK